MIADTAILTVDLDAIAANWALLRARHGRDVAGVVKADAYGLGAREVVARLVREGCRHFFVAHLSEAAAIRDVAPEAMLAVLDGVLPGEAGEFAARGIVPVLNDLGQIAAWRAEVVRLGRRLPALLHVDTGMNRLGLPPAEVDTLAADPALLDGIGLLYVMTHLVSAEMPDAEVNACQRDAFVAARARLPAAPVSFANSSGIFLGPDFASDLARPGAALYGINPTPGQENPMLPVIRLQSRVIQTRTVEKGAGIGYGHTATAEGVQRLATISLGYADGWHRCAASAARFDGIELPFVGRVSMDSIILDISALPEGRLRPGDLVDLIDADQTIDDVAGSYGTIAYEVLTSLGHRFHRIHVGA